MQNKVICSKPFSLVYQPTGRPYCACCWADNYFEHSPSELYPLDHFNGDEMIRMRREMLLGEKTEFLEKFCAMCWKKEERYGNSPRLDNDIQKEVLENFNSDGTLKDNSNNPFIDISLNIWGNYCNLQCYECKPVNSTSRIALMKILDPKWSPDEEFEKYEFDYQKIDVNAFNSIIDQLVDNADKISQITIVGGEPMLMKPHFELLDKLIDSKKSKHISLSYVSNMTLMTLQSMKKYFDNFKFTYLQWSVDALGERNEWLRYPTNWKETLSNSREIQKYFSEKKVGTIRATITPTIFSITTFKETYDWMFANGFLEFGDDQSANTVSSSSYLSPKYLPRELKDKIAPDILKVSKYRYNELMSGDDENKFKLAVEYCDAVDKARGTNWRSVFPEIAEYAS